MKNYPMASITDSLQRFMLFKYILDLYYEEHLPKQLLNLAIDDGIEWINHIKFLSSFSKKQLQLKYALDRLQTLPVRAGEKLIAQFTQQLNHPAWTAHLIEKQTKFDLFPQKLHLVDHDNHKIPFDLIVSHYYGKLIYIDLWAAWCIPCLREIGPMEKLAQQYKDQVAVLYLSLENSRDRWIMAENLYLKDKKNDSYFIDSLNHMVINESMDIWSIPRYLLYNQKGILIHGNAPWPGSDEIVGLIDQYLTD